MKSIINQVITLKRADYLNDFDSIYNEAVLSNKIYIFRGLLDCEHLGNAPELLTYNAVKKTISNQLIKPLAERVISKSNAQYLVDSNIRFRRQNTVDAPDDVYGAHFDHSYGWPRFCVNFWIPFTKTNQISSVQIFPFSDEYKSEYPIGRINYSQYLKNNHQFLSYLKKPYCLKLSPNDAVMFNSGSILHSSPLSVTSLRISCDFRITKISSPISYCFEDIIRWKQLRPDSFDVLKDGYIDELPEGLRLYQMGNLALDQLLKNSEQSSYSCEELFDNRGIGISYCFFNILNRLYTDKFTSSMHQSLFREVAYKLRYDQSTHEKLFSFIKKIDSVPEFLKDFKTSASIHKNWSSDYYQKPTRAYKLKSIKELLD